MQWWVVGRRYRTSAPHLAGTGTALHENLSLQSRAIYLSEKQPRSYRIVVVST